MKKSILLVGFFTVFIIHGFAQSWTQKNAFPGTKRHACVSFSIGTKGYIGTGNDSTGDKKDFWEWDQVTNAWTQKANFGGSARSEAVGFSIGTKGYIGTGKVVFSEVSDFWEWDQATNVWTKKASLSTPRTAAVGFSIGTKGYIGTGVDGLYSTFYSDFWEWNQANNTWTQKAVFKGAKRCYAVGFSIGTKAYIGTGSSGGSSLKDFWEWDQGSNSWVQKADFGGGEALEGVGFSIGTRAYVGLSGSVQELWEWNQASNTWKQGAKLDGRSSATAFVIGNKGYVGTGWLGTSSYNKNDFWEFDPGPAGIPDEETISGFTIYPNPYISSTRISYTLKQPKNIRLEVYNAIGQKIETMLNTSQTAGEYTYTFSAKQSGFTKGIYLVKLTIGEESITQRIIEYE